VKSTSLVDAARANALLARIRRGAICLDDREYRVLRYLGFSRRDVDRAVDRLVAAGQVDLVSNSGAIWVRLPQAGEKRKQA
jgi:hypothetical protein